MEPAVLLVLGFIALVAIMLCTGIAIGNSCGYKDGYHQMEQNAIDAGLAEWTVTSKGKVGFRWKTVTEITEQDV
jgi:hypothetical protein